MILDHQHLSYTGSGPNHHHHDGRKPETGRVTKPRDEPAIIHSTLELMELSTDPNAQVVYEDEDAAYSRVPPSAENDEMIQRLPKRKEAGNGWSRSKKGGKSTVVESSTVAALVGNAETDLSKEERAANLRRVVFQPSTTVKKKG
jgi:hypothetical protein